MIFALFRCAFVNFFLMINPYTFSGFYLENLVFCLVFFIQTPANGRLINAHINSRVYVEEQLVQAR